SAPGAARPPPGTQQPPGGERTTGGEGPRARLFSPHPRGALSLPLPWRPCAGFPFFFFFCRPSSSSYASSERQLPSTRSRRAAHPIVLKTEGFDVEVLRVKSGWYWTNVWMDARIHSTSNEEQLFDPRELELFVPALGIVLKHSQRQLVVHSPGDNGERDDQNGRRDWTPPTKISAGSVIQVTLMFETNPRQTKEMHAFELVYRGQRALFAEASAGRPPRPSSTACDHYIHTHPGLPAVFVASYGP